MLISKYLSLQESCYSFIARSKGIPNEPDMRAKSGLSLLAKKVYDPICEKFGKVLVTSGYRSPQLNTAIGGAKLSAHTRGEALDLDARSIGLSNIDLFHFSYNNLDFDQLIAEFEKGGEPEWIHISYKASGNRKQALIAVRKGKDVTYHTFTQELFNKFYRKTKNRSLSFSAFIETETGIVDSGEGSPSVVSLQADAYDRRHRANAKQQQ
jgi:hypothetical protein